MDTLRCRMGSKQIQTIVYTMSKAFSSAQNLSKTTVDNAEISHFKSLGSAWWENSNSKVLQAMNQLRVPFIRDGLINTGVVKTECINTPEPLKGLQILEVGCGGGILSEAIARLGAKTTGIDASLDLVEVAKNHAALDASVANNIVYEYSTVENHALNNAEKYDAVVSSEVIEHITEKKLFVEGCTQCLKPGGSIFFTTFDKTYMAWFVGIIIAEYVVRVLPKGTHEWDKFIAPHQLQRLLEDYNCHTTVVHGMWYNIFLNRWSWTTDTSLTYALQAVKK